MNNMTDVALALSFSGITVFADVDIGTTGKTWQNVSFPFSGSSNKRKVRRTIG